MPQDKKPENVNPVARLREIYYERRRNRVPLTETEKDALRKDKEKHDKSEQKRDERKIAREPDFEVDL